MESINQAQPPNRRPEWESAESVHLLPKNIDKAAPIIDGVLTVRGWPQSPLRLKRLSQPIATVVGDLLLCIIALLFVALGAICIRLDQTPISSLGSQIRQITRLVRLLQISHDQ